MTTTEEIRRAFHDCVARTSYDRAEQTLRQFTSDGITQVPPDDRAACVAALRGSSDTTPKTKPPTSFADIDVGAVYAKWNSRRA